MKARTTTRATLPAMPAPASPAALSPALPVVAHRRVDAQSPRSVLLSPAWRGEKISCSWMLSCAGVLPATVAARCSASSHRSFEKRDCAARRCRRQAALREDEATVVYNARSQTDHCGGVCGFLGVGCQRLPRLGQLIRQGRVERI